MITNTTQTAAAQSIPTKSVRAWPNAASIGLGLSLMLLPSCGVSPVDQDLTGTWTGTLTGVRGDQNSTVITDEVVFTLVQIGDSVSGSFVTQGGATGDISGSIEEGRYFFTIVQGGLCLGSFSGTAMISGVTGLLEGSYVGADCAGSLDASFSAARLP